MIMVLDDKESPDPFKNKNFANSFELARKIEASDQIYLPYNKHLRGTTDPHLLTGMAYQLFGFESITDIRYSQQPASQ